jgi:hypothetical protein
MKKSDGDGKNEGVGIAHPEPGTSRRPASVAPFSIIASPALDGIVVLPLSKPLRLLLPPLFISSLPKRAIGFSFPRGVEGMLVGSALVGGTALLAYLLDTAFGLYAAAGIVWLMGGTGLLVLYNSARHPVAFVKEMCSTCRLRPIIEEHEMMHLNGEASEEAVWKETRKKYTYEGLGLGTDPRIHSFCPIAKRLRPADGSTVPEG